MLKFTHHSTNIKPHECEAQSKIYDSLDNKEYKLES